jgi:hypothetical protein
MNDESKDAQSFPSGAQTDTYLQALVKNVNDAEERFSMPMTVLVGGTLVSGSLIGIEEYFETLASEFAAMFTDPDEAAMAKESFKPSEDMPPPSEGDPLPQYIHFKDARYYSVQGGPIVAGPGVLWRGRISEVGGFHFGCLAPSPT